MDIQTSSKLDKSYLHDYIPRGKAITFRMDIHRLFRGLFGEGLLLVDLIFRLIEFFGGRYIVELGFGRSNPGKRCGSQGMRRYGSSNPSHRLLRIRKWKMNRVTG